MLNEGTLKNKQIFGLFRRFRMASSGLEKARRAQELCSMAQRGEVMLKHRFFPETRKRSIHRRFVWVDFARGCFYWATIEKSGNAAGGAEAECGKCSDRKKWSYFPFARIQEVKAGLASPSLKRTGKRECEQFYFSIFAKGDDRTGDFETLNTGARVRWVEFFQDALSDNLGIDLCGMGSQASEGTLWSDTESKKADRSRPRRPDSGVRGVDANRGSNRQPASRETARDADAGVDERRDVIACLACGEILMKHRVSALHGSPLLGKRYVWLDLRSPVTFCWREELNLFKMPRRGDDQQTMKVSRVILDDIVEVRLGVSSAVFERTGRKCRAERYFSLYLQSEKHTLDFECPSPESRNRWAGLLADYLEGALPSDLLCYDPGLALRIAAATSKIAVDPIEIEPPSISKSDPAWSDDESDRQQGGERRGASAGIGTTDSQAGLPEQLLSSFDEERVISFCESAQKGDLLLRHRLRRDGKTPLVLRRFVYADFNSWSFVWESVSSSGSAEVKHATRISLADIAEVTVGRSSPVLSVTGVLEREAMYFTIWVSQFQSGSANSTLSPVDFECSSPLRWTKWVEFFAALLSGLLGAIGDDALRRGGLSALVQTTGVVSDVEEWCLESEDFPPRSHHHSRHRKKSKSRRKRVVTRVGTKLFRRKESKAASDADQQMDDEDALQGVGSESQEMSRELAQLQAKLRMFDLHNAVQRTSSPPAAGKRDRRRGFSPGGGGYFASVGSSAEMWSGESGEPRRVRPVRVPPVESMFFPPPPPLEDEHGDFLRPRMESAPEVPTSRIPPPPDVAELPPPGILTSLPKSEIGDVLQSAPLPELPLPCGMSAPVSMIGEALPPPPPPQDQVQALGVPELLEDGPPGEPLPPPPPRFSKQLDAGVHVFRKRGSMHIVPPSVLPSGPLSVLDEIKSPGFHLKRVNAAEGKRRSMATGTLPALLLRTMQIRRAVEFSSSSSGSEDDSSGSGTGW